jgi:hypothetical protein
MEIDYDMNKVGSLDIDGLMDLDSDFVYSVRCRSFYLKVHQIGLGCWVWNGFFEPPLDP